ncbi:hypothetical protein L207DRAFT_509274 [Hyaloscypha variabilis F]|uniref:Uncharacterized protein n=1 Tax=Hyaloscypha variabilis (strain UAMH 11265 / GT02V1 / F) TaxID=1149755 RepID=A0A2J6S1A6_HYAVF|nr:hypothetical protein L207DRAFT_509274 [Hyaloscypha variabilis F]
MTSSQTRFSQSQPLLQLHSTKVHHLPRRPSQVSTKTHHITILHRHINDPAAATPTPAPTSDFRHG